MFSNVFSGKTVWLSGHTGFKGSWLAVWLLELGARVHGYSLEPDTTPSLFEQAGLKDRLHHEIGDLRDRDAVKRSLEKCSPDFVFHLGAQPLVLRSYEDPVGNYATNVMGTIHVLDALRDLRKSCAAVFVTTDKCYENREWVYGYREEDPMGGYDPYSSSKGMAELAISAYRRSFFKESPVQIASARAGNVIGGGDWADNRIVPDCMRALGEGKKIPVRNPSSTRPFQHVLEPLSGYLWLAACMARPELARCGPNELAGAYNFGPSHEANRPVKDLVEEILRAWPGEWEDLSQPTARHEAKLLQLSIDKVQSYLGWKPVWSFAEGVKQTVAWYREQQNSNPAQTVLRMRQQIQSYAAQAANLEIPWSE